MSRMTLRCSLPKFSAIWRLDATGSPFWVDKMISFKINLLVVCPSRAILEREGVKK
nr:MAG TPA: hypothetical protein [Caudoviricetes sp.]